MTADRIRGCLVLLLLMGAARAPFAQAQDPSWIASPSEAAQLPRFCWNQLMSAEFRGPEYQILDCGPLMNHYCLGLLKIVRANKTIGNLSRRKELLRGAKIDTESSLKDMKPYPQCSIREHAETTLIQIDSQLKAFK